MHTVNIKHDGQQGDEQRQNLLMSLPSATLIQERFQYHQSQNGDRQCTVEYIKFLRLLIYMFFSGAISGGNMPH